METPQRPDRGVTLRRRTPGLGLALLTAAVLGAAPRAAAADAMITLSVTGEYVPSPWTAAYTPADRSLQKFGYGLRNVLLGWLDLVLEPAESLARGDGLLPGMALGLRDGLGNTVGGLVHLVTSPIGRLDLTLPEDGVHLHDWPDEVTSALQSMARTSTAS